MCVFRLCPRPCQLCLPSGPCVEVLALSLWHSAPPSPDAAEAGSVRAGQMIAASRKIEEVCAAPVVTLKEVQSTDGSQPRASRTTSTYLLAGADGKLAQMVNGRSSTREATLTELVLCAALGESFCDVKPPTHPPNLVANLRNRFGERGVHGPSATVLVVAPYTLVTPPSASARNTQIANTHT